MIPSRTWRPASPSSLPATPSVDGPNDHTGHRRGTRRRAASAALAAGALLASGVALAPGAEALDVVVVTTTTDGVPGSLRDAVDIANSDADDTQIVLAAGATYQLTACGPDEDGNLSGDLDHVVPEGLRIVGNGATIEQTCPGQRVLHQTVAGTLVVADVTITGGDATGDGGGLLTTNGSSVQIMGSTFAGNQAVGSGGGASTPSAGGVTVSGSRFVDNAAGPGGDGGGLDASSGGAQVAVSTSAFEGNVAGVDGGGLIASGGSANVEVTDSSFVGNVAGDDGGGHYSAGGSAVLSVTGSTYAGNEAGERGGGAYLGGDGPAKALVDSTLVGNVAGVAGGGVGGGFADLALTYVTLTDNGAPSGSAVATTGQLLPSASIFAGTGLCSVGSTASTGWSWATDATCGLVGPGDVMDGADPALEPLADNGGPTPTRLPSFASPVVDAIPVADCPATTAVDQRGVARPDGAGCDIGAVEGEAPAPPPEVTPPTSTPTTPTTTPSSPGTGSGSAATPAAEAVTATPRFTG